MTSHNATRNAHDIMSKWIRWQRQRRTCYRVHNVAWCSIYECLFELPSTTNILHCHLVHNKNTSPLTILEMYVSAQPPLLALTETCFEVNTLGEFAPDRSVCSVGGGIEGGGCTCCPCNVMLARPHWVHDCWCLNYIDEGAYVYDLACDGNSLDMLRRSRVLKEYCTGCACTSNRGHNSQICESSYHIRKISVLKISG